MKDKQLFVGVAFAAWLSVIVLVTATAMPGLASAHTMDRDGAGRHAEQCVASMCKGRDARFCRDTLSAAMKEDRADFKRMRLLHEKLARVIDARTFNKKYFLDLTHRMADLHGAMMRRHMAAFAAVAARLNPQERKELMKNFMRASMKMAHHDMMPMMHRDGLAQQNQWFDHLNK